MRESDEDQMANRLLAVALSVIGMAWVVFFLIAFFSQTLPNNSDVSRLDLLENLPFLALDFLDPPEEAAPLVDSGWQFAPQRIPMLAAGFLIAAAAWGLGHLILRAVGLPQDSVPAVSVERFVFALGLGLSGLSLAVLGLGWFGQLETGLWRILLAVCFAAELVLQIIPGTRRRRQGRAVELDVRMASFRLDAVAEPSTTPGRKLKYALLTLGGCFVIAMLFGALSRPSDFDVCEYHLQGPKEWFQAGQVYFLSHNVYTSFPFLTEMISLLGMVVCDDWFYGALAGKFVLMLFAPLTALAVYAAGRRWANPLAGWLAAFVVISVPWTYRISIIAYAEGGLSFYLITAVLACGLCLETKGISTRLILLVGLLSGSAMATKYPGVVSVVIPAAVFLTFVVWRHDRSRFVPRLFKVAVVFSVGVFLTVGPWLLKNFVETGNPVYPLLYSVFPSDEWDADVDARWTKAHRPDHYWPGDIPGRIKEVTMGSDWLSPLLYAFAPLALLLHSKNRGPVILLWLFVIWLFATWWVLTHRLDRFWVPMLPVVALLAGMGAAGLLKSSRLGSVFVGVVVFGCGFFNLGFCSVQGLSGYNAWLSDLPATRSLPAKIGLNDISRLNEMLDDSVRVLSVGEAAVFNAEFDLVYNTVFDDCFLEIWSEAEDGSFSISDLRERLGREGITHLYVNWEEILRYRRPGSYGYTDFVTRERIAALEKAGLLLPFQSGAGQLRSVLFARPLEKMSEADLSLIRKWSPALLRGDQFVCAELFVVQP